MISDTIFVIQNSPFVKWMTHNTLFYGSYGDGWIIATYGHCTSWMLYKYTIEQFYSFREKMHCIKLYCIYFKSMCLVTIPLVDYATLFCLEVKAAKETKELFIISIIFKIIFNSCFKIWTICRGLVLFWPIAAIAFSLFLSKLRYQISSQTHCFEQIIAKVLSIILQIIFANVTPIGPLEKMQSRSTCSTSSFCRSH